MNTIDGATQQLQERHMSSRFSSAVDEWPPYQPKHYTTLAFIHNKGKHTDAVRFSVAQELAMAGKINTSEFHKHTKLNVNMTKNISDIFLPIVDSDGSSVDLRILIEGAPGIGKTVLAKEIAYQWAKNKLMTSKKLLLLVFLRECYHIQLKSVENLVQYVFEDSKMVSCLTNHLLQTEGSNTVIIFDGFDELSEEIKKESIIIDIINHRKLTKCCLVVTSRPTASSCLHGSVNRRIEIVGFTEEDRLDYIQSAFENSDDQVKALQHYLQSNPTINALCYIPLNMTIFLCLFEDRMSKLPKTQTEMYEYFTQMTILRFIKKYENYSTIISIANLPIPYKKVFVELAKLAYKALKTDKIVFTLSEIEQGCPNLTVTPSNWNGLGLLKAVSFFSTQMGNNQVTFHFLHFSIQEYMAAWYISTLSNNKQIKLLKKTFWKYRYYNTWTMYVGITSGSSFALKHFLSGNRFQFYSKLFKPSKVSSKYLKHKMKCLHLFQCLVEAGKEDDIKSVKQLFQSNQIDLSNQTLLPSDLNTLGFFLIRSINKEWVELNLSCCNIGLNGSNILCDRLLDKDVRSIVTVKMVNFSHNQLNCDSVIHLFGLFKSWHTSEIIITDDAILDSTTDTKKIEDIVLESSTLTLVFIGCYLFSKSLQLNKILANTISIRSIYLLNCNWKSTDSEVLKLLENQKLEKVRIIGPYLDTTMIKTIACMLVYKNRYVNMLVYDPTMSDKFSDFLSSLLLNQNKDVLGLVLIASRSKIQGFINTYTFSNELSALELYNLNEYLKTKVHLWRQDIDNSGKNITCNAFVKTLLNNNDWFLQVSLLEGDTVVAHKTDLSKLVNTVISLETVNLQNVVKLHIFRSNITDQAADDIAAVISCNIHLQEFNLCTSMVQASGILNISRSLQKISSLRKLYINHNNITYEAAGNIAATISSNKNLQEFDISGNNLQTAGVIKIMKALKGLNTLRKLYISNNSITDEVADYITAVISCNTDIKVLDISGNNLQASGAIKIGNFLQNIYTPKTLFITNSDNPADVDVSAVISENASLQEIYIYSNNLQTTAFTKPLQAICTLSKLHIGYNNISDEVANDIAIIVSCNTKLNKVEISGNKLQTTGITKILKSLHKIYALKNLDLNHSNITEEAANVIATVFSINTDLQELNLGGNDLQKLGAIKIAKGLQKISSLTKLYIDHNNITDEAADDIAAAISCNIHLQELNLGGNDFRTSGIIVILRSLQKILLLRRLYINHNNITYEAAGNIATAISCNKNLQEFDISGNNILRAGVIKIMKALKGLNTLRKLYISNNSITDEVADDITAVISCNTDIKVLDISGNNLQANGAIKIGNFLQNIYTPKTLFITNSDNPAHVDISAVISDNASLQEIYIYSNNLQTTEVEIFTKSLRAICTLSKLHVGYNYISDEVANDIAIIVSCNKELNKVEISRNKLQITGATKILKSLHTINALKNLDLNHSNITEEAANVIATAFSFNTDLQVLNLGGNDLQKLGAIKIAKGLQKISSLTKLYIDHNNITDKAADDIAAAISCNIHLQELNLGSNNLQSSGTIRIARSLQKISSLTKLYIDHNNITDEAADDIAAAISSNMNLQELNLGGNDLQTSGIIKIAKSLQKMLSLTKLYIDHNNITDESADDIAAAISSNMNLQELNLGRNNLQSSGTIRIARTLQKNSSLRKLYIDHNKITDEAADDIAAAISCNIHIQELNLGSNNLQSSGTIRIARSLQKISSLTKLYIDHNNITDEAADDIAAAISSNMNLQELNLGGNDLQTSGIIKIAKSLQKMLSLTKLYIDHNNITDETADDIAAAISSNMSLQELNLGSNNLQSSGTIRIARTLQKNSSLRKLYIDHNKITDEAADDIAAAISCNIHIQELNLGSNNLQSSGTIRIVKTLQKISSLRKLYFDHSKINDEAADDIAAAISCNIHIQELNLGSNNLQSSGTIRIVKTLQKISSLTKLYIDHNNITDEAADDIAAAISSNMNLQELNLGGNDLQTSGIIKIAKSLQKMLSLTKLYIDHNNITDEAADDIAAAISSNMNLQELNLGGNDLQTSGIIKIAKSLQKMLSLTKLYIDHNNITDEAADDIAAAISSNMNLQELNLGGNDLQTSGILKIAKSLQKMLSLTKLCIDHSNITDEAVDDIAAAIFCNQKLQEFDISENKLQKAGATKVLKALTGINTLRKLYISNNYITDEVADDITAVISHNTDMEMLDISGNNLQANGAIKIGNFLQKIYTPKTLFITNKDNVLAVDVAAVISGKAYLNEIYICNLQTAGIKILGELLQAVCTLSRLHIGYNSISDELANDIATIISHNTKLKEIEIIENEIQTTGAVKMMKGLRRIDTLKIFYFNNNNITEEAADDIAAVFFFNNNLQELNLGGNNLQTSGAITIAKSLTINISSLTKLCINHNNINTEAADDIAAVISCNIYIQELNLSSNNLQASGIVKIARSLQKISSLIKLYINHNSISTEAADDIAAVISCNIYIQELNLGGNDFRTSGIIVVARSLQKISSLKMLRINDNNITYEAADNIATAISCNVYLQDLNIGGNDLRASGIIVIARSLQKISSLRKLYINHSNITDEAADSIRAAISCNANLQELDLGGNNLQAFGIVSILKGLQKISSLTKLYINHNNITDEAADDIADAISCNQKLQAFNLSGNILQPASTLKITKALKDISTLKKTIF